MGRRAVVILLVVAGAAAISAFGFFYFRDNFATHYPIKVISAEIFRAGQIPWWNFYDGGGQPLAGNPNTLTFYPDNFLYLIFPAHVAFNLHFLLHLALAWLAMRALSRAAGVSRNAATFAATLYAMSGAAISATAFYNLITAVALIPLALWAVERDRSPLVTGAAFGLIGLAGEPVVAISTAICVLIAGWRRIGKIAVAALIAIAIALPQILAYAEIAGEVERVVGFSATTTLNASLWPIRIAEIVVGPVIGFLTDPGHADYRGRLFSYLFIGAIVVPALARRSRYVAMAALMLFFSLGRYNPIVKAVVESAPRLRIARYPEKFAIALTVSLVVLVAMFVDRLTTKWRVVWGAITFVPLAVCLIHGAPIDRFEPYDVGRYPYPVRLCSSEAIDWGAHAARDEYRAAATHAFPIFGAVAGVHYATNRSPEGMHSLASRIVAERVVAVPPPIRAVYQRIAGCSEQGARSLPPAWIVPRAIGVRTVNEAVAMIESGRFDEHAAALAPMQYANFESLPVAHIVRYTESLQEIEISVITPAPALVFVNQSFFRAWTARIGDRDLQTLPLDIDRLGVIVPAGENTIVLRFGRHRTLVVIAWVVSSLLLLAGVLALRVEVLDRRAGEVERPADEEIFVF